MAYSRFDQSDYRPQFGGFSFFPPVIKYLIFINVGAFILQWFVGSSLFTYNGIALDDWFALTFFLWPLGEGFSIWQLITYMFLHGSFWHIFLNMLMLWMFGMEIENTWGSRKFLVFYFACGIAAGLSNLFVAPIFTVPGPTIGASGGVYGVLVAFAMMFPNRYIYIYFLLPVKAKYLITFFIALEIYNGIAGSIDGIAHMAHLGGAIVGAIWVVLESRGSIDRLFLRFQSGSPMHDRRSASLRWKEPVKDATFYEIKPEPNKKKRIEDEEFNRYQLVIDEILDKISKTGYSGLTDEEKRILLDASKKIHPDKGADS